MTRVDLYSDCMVWPVGDESFVRAFFSTVARRLEPEGWGTRFPALMQLAGGRLACDRADAAIADLQIVRDELAELPPDARVFDYDDPGAPTPWPCPPGASTAADCFLTVDAVDFVEVMRHALAWGQEAQADIELRPQADRGDTHRTFVTGEGRADA